MRVPGFCHSTKDKHGYLLKHAKECNKCGELKYFTEFNYDIRNKDGLQGYCKICSSKGPGKKGPS